MRSSKNTHCKCCHRIRLKQTINKNGICLSCKRHANPSYFIENDALPVWYPLGDKANEPQYHIPIELQNLTLAEKMLIQRVSPFVPLQHIKNGVMGIKGHVCAFEQDIKSTVSKLPRPMNSVDIIHIEQSIRSEVGSELFTKKAYRVSRRKVLTALYWLKSNNPEYMDIEIDENELEWIGGSDSAYLDVKRIHVENDYENQHDKPNEEDSQRNQDNGPLGLDDKQNEILTNTGFVDNGGFSTLSNDDSDINDSLQDSVLKSSKKKQITMNWPDIQSTAVNEYGDVKVFARAFPWLFPGGFGDPIDYPQSLGEWGSQMLFYEDARFMVDPIFCFFALNYVIRHRNSSSGRFFIDKFQKDCPETLSDLKTKIEEGDTTFINSLSYYNKRVKGTNSYWSHKRSEVYSWINHHVEVGNGAPMFFITLSCAEYYWKDIEEIIKDRLEKAGRDTSNCKVGHPGFPQLVNDFAAVVQEYFQERVQTWLDVVGKAIFGIQHYWVRYEFTPGRGQIHAHLLAITDQQNIYKLAHDAGKIDDPSPGQSRAEILSNWASKKIGLTASTEPGFDEIDPAESMPTTIRFMDLDETDVQSHDHDDQALKKHVQVHQCSGFCMRKGKQSR